MWISKDEFAKVKDREWQKGYAKGRQRTEANDSVDATELPEIPPLTTWEVKVSGFGDEIVRAHVIKKTDQFTDFLVITEYERVSDPLCSNRIIKTTRLEFRINSTSIRSLRRVDDVQLVEAPQAPAGSCVLPVLRQRDHEGHDPVRVRLARLRRPCRPGTRRLPEATGGTQVNTDFLGPLYGVDHVPVGDEDLLFYWSTPGARDIANFVWDTTVPTVTDPWPQLEPASIRDAMVMVLGREDVTGRLYALAELDAYLDSNPEVVKAAIESGEPLLTPQDPCEHCGLWCEDKWCGLRGDEPTQVIDATEWSDHGTVRAE